MINFDIISLFPEYFNGPFSCGTLKIAREKGIIKVNITNPRDFTDEGTVDDYQYGGGAGMVLKPEPLVRAIEAVKRNDSIVVNFSPAGQLLSQKIIQDLSGKCHLILICGRYKGIDERINLIYKPLEISIGDYVLAGGEAAALVLIEAITRLLPGVLGNIDSAEDDSLQAGLLAADIYTRPDNYKMFKVPSVLKSGDHKKIARWRRKESLRKTLIKRPELLGNLKFSKEDLDILLEVVNETEIRI
ncbi:MAG: tRNA (guanosine(37)-N1)-methyltransferase TrmD [candidate division WOR-3 bacterium]